MFHHVDSSLTETPNGGILIQHRDDILNILLNFSYHHVISAFVPTYYFLFMNEVVL